MDAFPHRPVRPLFPLLLLVATLALEACSGKDSPVTPPGGDTPNPPQPPVQPADPDSASSTVGTSGGSVLLPDGTGVIVPAGALSSSASITVKRIPADSLFDGSTEMSRVILSLEASVSQFNSDVEVRVPLPAGATQADSSNVLAGVVDDDDGYVEVEHSSVKVIDGKPFVVVETNHFSNRLFEWLFGKKPPATAGPLPVPYYNQGSSNYCWATSIQMVTQAVSFSKGRSIADIIGKAGVDEGGIGYWTFRTSSDIANIVQSRTGVRPDRAVWDAVNIHGLRDLLWREIGVNGRPVAIMSTKWNHALVVVGYDTGVDGTTFSVHDPQATGSDGIGYATKTWDEMATGMWEDLGATNRIVSMVIPKGIATGDRVVVNLEPQAFELQKPKTGTEGSKIYEYQWDYRSSTGYAMREVGQHDIVDTLPGETTTLVPGDAVELSNDSRNATKNVIGVLRVIAKGAPQGSDYYYTTQQNLTLPPNSVRSFQPERIPVDTFRYNQSTPTEYLYSVKVLDGGTAIDEQTAWFTIAGVTPVITDVSPASAAVGDQVTIHGSGFGSLPLHNVVTFNGVAAGQVVSWSDADVVVVVPDGAVSGPVVLKRGEVASSPFDFSVSAVRTVTRAWADTLSYPANMTVAGAWSITGVSPTKTSDFGRANVNFEVASLDEGVTLTFSLSGKIDPSEIVFDDGTRLVYRPIVWSYDAAVYPDSSEVTYSVTGSEGDRSYTIRFTNWGNQFCVGQFVDVFYDHYDSHGTLDGSNQPGGGTGFGTFCVIAWTP